MKKMLVGPTCARIRERLTGKQFDHKTVSQTCFVQWEAARYNLTALHKAKEIHIVAWQRNNNGPWYAIYEFGHGKDVPKPKVQTDKEYRQNNPETAMRERARYLAKKQVQVPGARVHVC